MSTIPTNTDDVIDSRDVIERAAELAAQWTDYSNREDGSEPLTDEEKAELDSLSVLITQGEQATDDWQWGATLVRDSYFTEYARDFAEDLYGKDIADAHWPFTCIDWEHAASELKMDYTPVEFAGVTYWVR